MTLQGIRRGDPVEAEEMVVRTDGNRVLEWNICKQHNLSIHFVGHSRQYYYDIRVFLNKCVFIMLLQSTGQQPARDRAIRSV